MVFFTANGRHWYAENSLYKRVIIERGQATRTRADNPIAIHHQPERYTTIAPALINYFFSPLPLSFSTFFFPPYSRSKTARTSRLFTVPGIQLRRREWLSDRREASRLLSSIKCPSFRGQTLSAKSRRFFFSLFCSPIEICRWRAPETRSIKKSSRKKFVSTNEARETLSNSLRDQTLHASCSFIGSNIFL